MLDLRTHRAITVAVPLSLFLCTLPAEFVSSQEMIRADLNGDGQQATVIDFCLMLGQFPIPGFNSPVIECDAAADLNDDGLINAIDLNLLLEMFLGITPLPPASCEPPPPTLLTCSGTCDPVPPPPLSEIQLSLGTETGTVGEQITVDLTLTGFSSQAVIHGFALSVVHDPDIVSVLAVEDFGMVMNSSGELLEPDLVMVSIESDRWSGYAISSQFGATTSPESSFRRSGASPTPSTDQGSLLSRFLTPPLGSKSRAPMGAPSAFPPKSMERSTSISHSTSAGATPMTMGSSTSPT